MALDNEQKEFIVEVLKPYLENDDYQSCCKEIISEYFERVYGFSYGADIVNFMEDSGLPIIEEFDKYIKNNVVNAYDIKATFEDTYVKNWEFKVTEPVVLNDDISWEVAESLIGFDDDDGVDYDKLFQEAYDFYYDKWTSSGLAVDETKLILPVDAVVTAMSNEVNGFRSVYSVNGKYCEYLEDYSLCEDAENFRLWYVDWDN